jgi:hypothetical protein
VIKIYLEDPPEESNQPCIVISAADAML